MASLLTKVDIISADSTSLSCLMGQYDVNTANLRCWFWSPDNLAWKSLGKQPTRIAFL